MQAQPPTPERACTAAAFPGVSHPALIHPHSVAAHNSRQRCRRLATFAASAPVHEDKLLQLLGARTRIGNVFPHCSIRLFVYIN